MKEIIFTPAVFVPVFAALLMGTVTLFAVLKFYPIRRGRQKLSIMFYRRVVAISNDINNAARYSDNALLDNCKRRINNDLEFTHPDATVVREMLLSDISEAKLSITTINPNKYQFLNN